MFARALVIVACLMPLAIEARQIPAQDATLTLAVRYADGRIVQHVVGQDPGSAWTPVFPRVAGWQPAAGDREVEAIQFGWSRVGDAVQVKVSVLRGRPHQEEIPVVTVVVRPTGTVVVDAVRTFGVETVQLSLSAATRVAVEIPRTTSAVAGIVVISVETAQSGSPRYRVTLQNRSQVNVRAFTIEAYRSGRLVLSGRRAGMEGRPVIDVGGTYTFEVPISMATASDFAPAARPADEIKISSTLWSDGSVDGDAKKALETVASDYGNFLALTPIAEAYGRAATDAPADPRAALDRLRATINSLLIEPGDDAVTVARLQMRSTQLVDDARTRSLVRIGMQAVKTLALKDLSTFEERARDLRAEDVARTLSQAAGRYAEWRARLAR
jgi:hypothetical protein